PMFTLHSRTLFAHNSAHNLTVPIGLVGGLPAGIMVIGTAHTEETLLRIASCIEHTCDPLPMPEFREPAAG
ncbi:MAG: hypothetical protein ACP5OR_09400, partial [Candidatus Dormibacteria bacterium]